MKKLIRFSTFCIITNILLSSCGSNMSLTKRHYNNGYYLSYTENKHAELISKEEAIQTKTGEPLLSAQDLVEKNTKERYSVQNSVTDKDVVSVRNVKMQQKINSHQSQRQVIKQKIKIMKDRVAQFKRIPLEMKKIRKDSSEREDLSLFWIVILVVLILWALGLLAGGFGIGGLINLLLLVALILLILWLLRII